MPVADRSMPLDSCEAATVLRRRAALLGCGPMTHGCASRGRRQLALVLVLAIAAAVLAAPRAHAAMPRDFFGVDYRSAEPTAAGPLGELRVGVVRQVFDWAGIEPAPGDYRFEYYDRFVAAMARARIRSLPVLFETPPFRSSAPATGARRGFYPPRDYADLARFALVLVRRYGSRGSFWAAHPELPRVPVRAWQVWNEPNLPVYWPSGPDPRAYVRMLRVVSRAIHAADRHALVLTAGVPESKLGIRLRPFLRGMYRAGGRGAFDALAINAYASSARNLLGGLRDIRALMNHFGDRRRRMWVTEFGWATGGPPTAFSATLGDQAARISAALTGMVRSRRALGLRGIVYYQWRDASTAGQRDFWGLHTGLLDADGNLKPGYFAFRDVLTRYR